MSHARTERGAVAIMVAIMASVLLLVAALAVDLGNLVSRKTWTQTQADHSALAGGSELASTPLSGGTPSADVVAAVAEYMNANQPQDDDRPCWRATPATCVTTTQLTNGDEADGEVRYTASGLQVVTPRAWVDFGLAGSFIEAGGASVVGAATVQIKTGGMRTMPMYGVSGCDWGRQTLVDPANSPVPIVPTLYANADTNTTDLDTVTLRNMSGTVVTELAPGSTGNILSLKASKWDKSKRIGFFPDNTDAPTEVTEFWLEGDSTFTDLSPASDANAYTSNPSKTVQATIPANVSAAAGVWWVRVWNSSASGGTWSPANDAIAIRVGGSVLECNSASNEGNFGTLRWPRTTPNQTSQHLPANIALGLQDPLNPTIHVEADATGFCTHDTDGNPTTGSNAVVSWGANLRPNTNCVGTDPGVATTVLDQGLITGGPSYPGLLTTASTKPGCAPGGGSGNRTVTINPHSYSINNEVLTCYLTDTSTTLADIADPGYDDGPVLDKSIYSSPRFFYVPILSQDPGTGAQAQDSGHSIIDFRPAFLTDETATTTAVLNSSTGTTDNGLRFSTSGIIQMRVFFFNFEALPRDSDVPTIDFLGVGQKILRLVD